MQSVATDHAEFSDYLADDTVTEATSSDSQVSATSEEIASMKEALEAYKALGNPDDIAALLRDHYEMIETAKLSQIHDNNKPKAAKLPKSKLNADQKEEVRNTIAELFPGVERVGELLNKIDQVISKTNGLETKTVRETAKAASKQVASLIATEGYDAETAGFIEDAVANRIYSSPKLMERLHGGDDDVVQEVFEKINKEFLSKHVVRKARKPKPSDLADLLAGNVGKAGSGKDKSQRTTEDLDKMQPNDRMRAVGEDAFSVYQQIVETKKAMGQIN